MLQGYVDDEFARYISYMINALKTKVPIGNIAAYK